MEERGGTRLNKRSANSGRVAVKAKQSKRSSVSCLFCFVPFLLSSSDRSCLFFLLNKTIFETQFHVMFSILKNYPNGI